MRKRTAGALLALLAVGSGRAAGQERAGRMRQPIQEFLLAETVYLQGEGKAQLTVDARKIEGAGTRLFAELGLTDRFQVGVTTPYYSGGEEADEGWGGGVMYGVLDGESPFALSAKLDVRGVREAAPSSGKGAWEPRIEPRLVAAREVGPVQAHASAGLAVTAEATVLEHSIAFVVGNGSVVPTLELTGREGGGASSYLFTPGLHLLPRGDLDLAFGVPVAVRSGSERPRWVLQLTATF